MDTITVAQLIGAGLPEDSVGAVVKLVQTQNRLAYNRNNPLLVTEFRYMLLNKLAEERLLDA